MKPCELCNKRELTSATWLYWLECPAAQVDQPSDGGNHSDFLVHDRTDRSPANVSKASGHLVGDICHADTSSQKNKMVSIVHRTPTVLLQNLIEALRTHRHAELLKQQEQN